MFYGPCIVVYLCNEDQHDTLFTFSFNPLNNLYMFQAGLLLIIRRCYSVAGSPPILLAASQHKRLTYTNCYVYRVVPPDDEQKACSTHVEVI
jgi:hypothetical protein